MSRYRGTRIFKKGDGRRVLKSNILKPVPHKEQDFFVQASEYDRLDQLAYKYYNNTAYWWIIALANNIGKGSLHVPKGMILRIPSNPGEYVENRSRY